MKTVKKRIEELENGVGPKPILILWGDEENPYICRVGDEAGEVMLWAEAEEKFSQTNQLIAVRYVDDWRADVG